MSYPFEYTRFLSVCLRSVTEVLLPVLRRHILWLSCDGSLSVCFVHFVDVVYGLCMVIPVGLSYFFFAVGRGYHYIVKLCCMFKSSISHSVILVFYFKFHFNISVHREYFSCLFFLRCGWLMVRYIYVFSSLDYFFRALLLQILE